MTFHTHATLLEALLLENENSSFLQGIGDAQVDIFKSGVSACPYRSLPRSWAYSKLMPFIFLPSCICKMGIILWVPLSMIILWVTHCDSGDATIPELKDERQHVSVSVSHSRFLRKLDPSLVQNHDFGFLSGTSLTATVEKADQSGYLGVCSVSYCPMCVFLEGECSVEKGDLSR